MTHAGAASVDSVEPARWERAADLFIRWREGDGRSMDELVRLMTPVLWHIVRSYGLDAALAQDVVQTTWLTLVRRHASILDPQAVSGWLTMCARREAWRVGKQHRLANPTEEEALEARLPVRESAEQTATADDEKARLWAAVGSLDDRCRHLLQDRGLRRPSGLRTHRRRPGDARRVHRTDAPALPGKAPRLTRGRRMGEK